MMKLLLNGQEVEISEDNLTISKLLQHYDISEKIAIVEQNEQVVSKEKYSQQPIVDGDRIEIVHFVGGG
ncbi:sulfur carrier protein ThiS [Bacillus carboniphilus]|uniref:Sulfur carrier protein ThiS n=1 Tax=Bacillus carboniphilus TaxID=86663 RepID=A0ABY9JX11_9BACI|nr:sulfur carrier protein ThiS [Bacillus carboniphilus]WLR42960.1 sulfur carrier protein ThiS [Bacillus carboniphilus]